MLLHHNADCLLPHANPSFVVIVKPNRVVKKGEQITPYGLSAKAYYLFARNLKVRGFVLFSPRPLWVFMRFKSIRLLPSLIVTNVHEKVWYLPCRPYSASIVIVAKDPHFVNSKTNICSRQIEGVANLRHLIIWENP